jgi:ribonuclease E
MAKKMLIDATHAEETRVVVVDGNKVEEFDFETVNKQQLAGNIYLAKVTRVEPSLQAAFVDYGGNRHGFLAFSEIHPDYYQIPVADRQALLEEERAYAAAMDAEDGQRGRRRGPRPQNRAETAARQDEIRVSDEGATETSSDEVPGMEVADHGDEAEVLHPAEGSADTPAEAGPDRHGHDDHDGLDDRDGHDHGGDADGDDRPRGERYVAADHASETDDEIESVAEEDVAEEIRQPRKPRPRRYKIQEVIKVRQIMLVQVVKEERGNKGAALTTYLSLAGRYCVLMPNTARGGGISRKITNAADRKKLKEIATEIEVPEGAGLIIRTAGSQRTKTEIKRDYEYLMRLWEQVRDLTLKSIAPAPIYEEGDLIKRSIRDLYNKDIDEVLVEGEKGYRAAKDFMKMIMPSHAKNVKLYHEALPLFARYQVETYLGGMFNPVVQLKSGGYIVIGVTEALVAIDVNSGRATKEGSIEDTALKTNLEAAEEIARQLRLRDLAGLIVIDFIDMEERKNNAAVEKRLKEKLKTDRARIQVGRISGFGLLEMSRQRLRPGMLESTTAPCPHCHGTGLIRSDDSLALSILRQLEEEGTRKRSKEVLLKAPIAIVNFLMNQKREHIAQIEARYGLSVRVEADPALISPDFAIEKFKTATRVVPEMLSPVVSASAALMAEVDEDEDLADEEAEDEDDDSDAEGGSSEARGEGEPGKKKKRRRRRRRKGGSGSEDRGEGMGQRSDREDVPSGLETDGEPETVEVPEAGEPAAAAGPVAAAGETAAEKPSRSVKSTSSRSRSKAAKASAEDAAGGSGAEGAAAPAAAAEEAPVKKPSSRSRSSKKPDAPVAEAVTEAVAESAAEAAAEVVAAAPAGQEPAKKPSRSRSSKKPAAEAAETPAVPVPAEEAVAAQPDAGLQPDPEAAATPAEPEGEPRAKKRGWWSLGR